MQDRLSAILARFELQADVFFSGPLCGASPEFEGGAVGHLHLLRAGQVDIVQSRQARLCVSEPSLIYFADGSAHHLSATENQAAELLCANIGFGGAEHNPLLASLPSVLIVPLQQAPHLDSLLSLLFAEAGAHYCGRQAALNRLVELLMLQLFRFVMNTQRVAQGTLAGLADAKLMKVLVELHAKPEHAWNLERMAELCAMSRSRFAAHFLEIVGTTPGDYLNLWRLRLAKTLLQRGKNVKRVAIEVGYADASALARAFSARFGLAPNAWLAQTKVQAQ